MLIGAHAILYSKDSDADRAFLRDVIGLSHVDVGGGWLIFGLPPSEVAVHPGERNDVHELYLMCDDVAEFVTAMEARGVRCEPVQNLRWGILTAVALPGGGRIGVYEPLHARPQPVGSSKNRKPAAKSVRKPAASAKKAAKKAAKKPVKKAGKKAGTKGKTKPARRR